jgi:hypothetical protein
MSFKRAGLVDPIIYSFFFFFLNAVLFLTVIRIEPSDLVHQVHITQAEIE